MTPTPGLCAGGFGTGLVLHTCTPSLAPSQQTVLQLPPLRKKSAAGFGDLSHSHDESRGLYPQSLRLRCLCLQFYGGSDGGAQAPPVSAGSVRFANPSELPPRLAWGGGFCKPHSLEAING